MEAIKKLAMLVILTLITFFSFALGPQALAGEEKVRIVESWNVYNFYSTYYGMRIDLTNTSDIVQIQFVVPQTDYNLYETGGVYSAIVFSGGPYDTGTVELEDLTQCNQIACTYTLNLENILTKDYRGSTTIQIRVMQDWSTVPSQYYEYFNANAPVYINHNAYRVIFISGLQIYSTQFFTNKIIEPVDPPPFDGEYDFVGWRDSKGNIWNFNDGGGTLILNNLQLSSNTGYLYAYFDTSSPIDGSGVGSIETPTVNAPDSITTILTAFGLASSKGYIFLYVVLILALTIGLLSLKVGMFATMIANLSLTALFMFLGYLPVFASIILIMVFVMAFMLSLRGGMANE
jgi:hypothetical protein